MAKTFQSDSEYAVYDRDGDGVITDEELKQAENIMKLEQEKMRLENEDAKEDQIRKMAWFALWGMLLYPVAVVVSILFGLDKAADILGDMAPTYFVAVAGLVAAFFGAQAYSKGK